MYVRVLDQQSVNTAVIYRKVLYMHGGGEGVGVGGGRGMGEGELYIQSS